MPLSGAIIGAGVLGAVGSVAGASTQANAAEQASAQQVAQDQRALATQVAGENVALQTQAPFVDVGTGALHSLANLYGISYAPQGTGQATTGPNGIVTPANSNAAIGSAGGPQVQQAADLAFQNSPDYSFAFNQGMQALQRSAAASGTLQSGGQVKAATEFGQGLASQQFGNYFNRLSSLANIGQSAAAGVSNTALTGGAQQGNTLQGIGTAQAAGTVGAGNAISGGITGGLSGIGSSITQGMVLSRLLGQGQSAYAPSGGQTAAGLSNFDLGSELTGFNL